jgi:hypothetical protein
MRTKFFTLFACFGLLLQFSSLVAQITPTICDVDAPDIYCGSIVHGNNNLDPNRLTEYRCDNYASNWYSGEKVYRLNIEEYGEVRLDLKILDRFIDLEFFLIREVCGYYPKPYYKVDKKDCIAQGVISLDDHRVHNILTRLDPGTYLVVVDGATKYDRGRFSLSVDCGYRDLCTKAAKIKCGDKLQNQSTINSRNDVWRYTCGTGVYDMEGNDRVYKIELEKPGKLFVEMNILTPGQDMQLFLAKGDICAERARTINQVESLYCLGKSPEYGIESNRRTLLQDLPAGTYYVIVDARMAMTQANYHISFNCNPVACGLSVTPNVLDFTNKGGSQTLTVKATRPWATEPTQSWLDLSPRSGAGNLDVKVEVLRKDDPGSRQEKLTFICGSETQTIVLTQKGGCDKPNANFTVSRNGRQVIVKAEAQDSASYAWDFGNGALKTTGLSDTVMLPLGAQRVCLTVTSPCGTASSCQLVKVLGFTEAEVSSIEQPKLQQVRLYPNPSQGDEVYLEWTMRSAGQVSIQIFDLSGRALNQGLSLQLAQGLNQIQVPIDYLHKGVYLVRVKQPESSWTQKLIVE